MIDKVKILEKTRALIIDEKHWIQGNHARDQFGTSVRPNDPSACQWCLQGAILCAMELDGFAYFSVLVHLIDEMERIMEPSSLAIAAYGLAGYNDTHTHREVIQTLDHVLTVFRNEAQN